MSEMRNPFHPGGEERPTWKERVLEFIAMGMIILSILGNIILGGLAVLNSIAIGNLHEMLNFNCDLVEEQKETLKANEQTIDMSKKVIGLQEDQIKSLTKEQKLHPSEEPPASGP